MESKTVGGKRKSTGGDDVDVWSESNTFEFFLLVFFPPMCIRYSDETRLCRLSSGWYVSAQLVMHLTAAEHVGFDIYIDVVPNYSLIRLGYKTATAKTIYEYTH